VRRADSNLGRVTDSLLFQKFAGGSGGTSDEDDNNDDAVERSDELAFYYEYLTLLLESNNAARKERHLVREWCILSTSKGWVEGNDPIQTRTNRLQKFVQVASSSRRATTDDGNENNVNQEGPPKGYYRNLLMLIDLSIDIGNYTLALDLVAEIIRHPRMITLPLHSSSSFSSLMAISTRSAKLSRTLVHLRLIAAVAIKDDGNGKGGRDDQRRRRHPINIILLRRVIDLFQEMAGMSSPSSSSDGVGQARICVVVDELLDILESCDHDSSNDQDNSSNDDGNDDNDGNDGSEPQRPIAVNHYSNTIIIEKETSFLHLITHDAPPSVVLAVLSRWSKITRHLSFSSNTIDRPPNNNDAGAVIHSTLRIALTKGAKDGLNNVDSREISTALLSIRRVRANERGGDYLLGDNGDFGGVVVDRGRRMVHRGHGPMMERSQRRGGRRMEKRIWQNMLTGTAVIDK